MGLALLAGATAPLLLLAPAAAPPKRIILISVDSLRPDFLGAYQPKAACSPQIDRFARHSLVFTDAVAQAPSTAPSHKSIFYSLYPSVHKLDIRSAHQEAVVSPIEILRRHGYRTAAFTGGGQLRKRFGFDRGFDLYWEPPRRSERSEKLREMRPPLLRWLGEHRDERFFLFVHTYQVHCPYQPPPELFEKCCSWYAGPIDPAGKCQSYYNSTPMQPDDYRFLRDMYCAELSVVDSFFRELLDRLEELGIHEDTLIALFSDHGESLGERRYVGHNELHQVQLRIPLIVRVPGVAPRRVEAPVEAIDLMPTVFEAAGLSPPYPFQGVSLLETLRGPAEAAQGRLRISERPDSVALQRGPWKAVFPVRRGGPPSLYRIRQDPEETADLSARHPEILQQLWGSYLEMRQASRDVSRGFLAGAGAERPLDPDLKRELEALGYVN